MTVNLYHIDPTIRPTYLRVLRSIELLKAMPLEYRAEYWWNEQFNQAQKMRDLLVPPKKLRDPRKKRQIKHRQKMNQMYGVTALSRQGRARRNSFLLNWE